MFYSSVLKMLEYKVSYRLKRYFKGILMLCTVTYNYNFSNDEAEIRGL